MKHKIAENNDKEWSNKWMSSGYITRLKRYIAEIKYVFKLI